MINSFLDSLLRENKINKETYDILKIKNLSDLELSQEFIKLKLFDEKAILELRAKFFSIPFKIIEESEIKNEVLDYIPEESAKVYQIIPIKKNQSDLEIGIVNPSDIRALDALKFIATQKRLNIKISLISLNNFSAILKRYRNLKGEIGEELTKISQEFKEEEEEKDGGLIEEAPVIKIVTVILKHSYENNASDIHIEPTRDRSRVRFRIDGILSIGLFFPKEIHDSVVARIKIMSNLRIDEKRLSQDGRFKSKISDKEIDFRVSTFPTQFGEKIQLRLLDSTSVINDLPELGLFGKNLDLIKEGIKKPYGLILLTGPTGAGKTTTLYSILNILNNETVNILTLEDPVEYYLEGVNQSQVRPEIGYTFATGLRSLVRQDPNIIMVGEIRDKETASLAINAALTGHIVISTLHTNNAVGVIPRLLEMGIEEYLLPTILNFVIAQRLIRKLCQSCKKSVKINDRAKEIINKGLEGVEEFTPELKLTENSVLYQPVGCSKCNQTGTSGRIGIYEVFIMTRELEEVILKRPTEVELKKQSEKQKMLTMKQSGIIQALKGLVSLEEVLRIIND